MRPPEVVCPKQSSFRWQSTSFRWGTPNSNNPKDIVTPPGKMRKLELRKSKSCDHSDTAGKRQRWDSQPVSKMLEPHSEPEGFLCLLGFELFSYCFFPPPLLLLPLFFPSLFSSSSVFFSKDGPSAFFVLGVPDLGSVGYPNPIKSGQSLVRTCGCFSHRAVP